MSNVINQTLGEIILEALQKAGLKQSVVAKKMNVKRQTINQLDRRKTFDLEFLQKLNEATGLDFTEYSYPQPKPRDSNSSIDELTKSNQKSDTSIEMSLGIKIKSSPEQISKVGELIMIFKREALRMGFTIL